MTWKGIKIYPLSHRDFRDYILPVSSSGRPYWYIFNNVGVSTIKLYPTPDENIIADQTNLFSSNIPNQCIIEGYRTPDQSSFKIPDFFRRRLLKAYVAKMCFAMESRGQNLKAQKYWSDKYNKLVEIYGELLYDLINKPRKLVASQEPTLALLSSPAKPLLPLSMRGVYIDSEE